MSYKCQNTIELMSIKRVHQRNVIFITIGFKYEPYLWNGCHDLMQKAISFNDVAIVYVKVSAYRIHFWYAKMIQLA